MCWCGQLIIKWVSITVFVWHPLSALWSVSFTQVSTGLLFCVAFPYMVGWKSVNLVIVRCWLVPCVEQCQHGLVYASPCYIFCCEWNRTLLAIHTKTCQALTREMFDHHRASLSEQRAAVFTFCHGSQSMCTTISQVYQPGELHRHELSFTLNLNHELSCVWILFMHDLYLK